MSEKPINFRNNPNFHGISGPVEGPDSIIQNGNPVIEALDRVHQRIIIDELTECYNSNYFEIFKKEHLNRRDLDRDHNRIGLVVVDVNNMKLYNDEFGHQFGNQVLKDISAFLKFISRKGDLLFRVGGDEFVLVCYNTNDHPEFEEVLCTSMQEKIVGSPYPVSFGCAAYDGSDHHSGLDATFAEADSRMYAVKKCDESHKA